MKTFVVSAISIVLVSILFCPMVMAAPSMPDDVQIIQPDPSLPKELSAFWGKWEGSTGNRQFFLIVEKIDEKKASLWVHRSGTTYKPGWMRYEASVVKVRGEHKLWYLDYSGNATLTLKGDYLDYVSKGASLRLSRVP